MPRLPIDEDDYDDLREQDRFEKRRRNRLTQHPSINDPEHPDDDDEEEDED